MKKYLKIFISSLLAGFCIAFGATVFLFCKNEGTFAMKVVGAFLFCIGLFTIIHFKLWLYTGKVGAILDNKPKYFIDLALCCIGNILGVFILASIIKLTKYADTLKAVATPIVADKQADSPLSILILAMLCGVMIYVAVKGHEKADYGIGKALFAFLPIVLFIICGFEHVVANTCYYTYAGVFNLKVVGYFILMAIGNGIGAVIVDGMMKLINYLSKEVTAN